MYMYMYMCALQHVTYICTSTCVSVTTHDMLSLCVSFLPIVCNRFVYLKSGTRKLPYQQPHIRRNKPSCHGIICGRSACCVCICKHTNSKYHNTVDTYLACTMQCGDFCGPSVVCVASGAKTKNRCTLRSYS